MQGGIGGGKRIRSEKRVFQNDRIFYDENGLPVKDHIIYKDFVIIHIYIYTIDGFLLAYCQGLLWREIIVG